MRKLHNVLVVLGVTFLGYLIWQVGPASLWEQLQALGWGVVPLIASEGVANLAHTLGWRQCLKSPNGSAPLPSLFRMAMAGFAINYLTPSASLGGEITKAALLASRHKGSEAVSSVLIDKLSMAFSHLLFVLLGSLLLLGRVSLPPALWAGMIVSSVLLTSGIVGFLLIQRQGKLGSLVRWLVAHKVGGSRLEGIAQNFSKVDEALKVFYRERPSGLLLAVAWHLVGHVVGIVQTWIFLRLTNHAVPLAAVIGAAVLCSWFDLLTFAVPLNLGALEGSRILALKAIGANAVQGMTYGIAVRIAQLFWAGYGLISYSLQATQARATKPSSLPA